MAVAANLEELSLKHSALERKIAEEMSRPLADAVRLSELKRQKLKIKDEMARLKQHTQ